MGTTEELLSKIRQHTETKDGNIVTDKHHRLVEKLAWIASEHAPEETHKAMEGFFTSSYISHLTDEELEKIAPKKWDKNAIANWTRQQRLDTEKDDVFNFNALVGAMNYEYMVHKDFIDTTVNPAMTSYNLAITALKQPGYMEATLRRYTGNPY